jgi:hypothetical protein
MKAATKAALATTAFLALVLSAGGAAAYDRYDPYGYDGYGAPRPPPARFTVRPRAVPYFDDYSNYYPAVRGFEDDNPVPRGNMRGCTVDLGYGRYESCDK